MTTQRAYTLHANDDYRPGVMLNCINDIRQLPSNESHRIEIRQVASKRSSSQNRKMWAMLNDIARQLAWPVNGARCLITPEDWKDLITAGLDKHQRIAQGIEGGVVMLGGRTSKMTKAEMAEFIEYIYWFGADQNVAWDEALQYVNKSADQMAA